MVTANIILSLVMFATLGFLIVAIENQRDAAAKARHTQLVISTANNLERRMVDLETGERGYLLTHQANFLTPWIRARQAFPEAAYDLLHLTRNPQAHRIAQRIVHESMSYINDYSIPLVNAARRNDPAAHRVSTIEEGKNRLDTIRADFETLAVNEQQRENRRADAAHTAAHRALLAAIAGITVSVAFIVGFAVYLSRVVGRPIRHAAGMAERLAGGDLSARMPENGIGEIATMQRSFNTMGESLERSRDELRRGADEQSALRRVATYVARGVAPAEVFDLVAEEAGRLLGADGVRMLRYETDGFVTIVAGWGMPGYDLPIGSRVPMHESNVAAEVQRTGAAARMHDIDAARGPLAAPIHGLGVRSVVGAPIVVEGRTWGVMIALSRQPALPADTESRFADYTDLLGTAIANTAARAELAASRARVVDAIDRGRRTIERDLHDGTQQRLVSIALDLRSIEARVPPEETELREELDLVATGLAGALDELREISRGIHPAILTEGGLAPALRALARRSPVPVDLTVRVRGRLDQRVEVAAYYVVAEALTNATKHAEAGRVLVEVTLEGSRLRLTVSDDGVGGADPGRGSGLIGLMDRVAALDGTITVDSPVGTGTTLRVELPARLSSG